MKKKRCESSGLVATFVVGDRRIDARISSTPTSGPPSGLPVQRSSRQGLLAHGRGEFSGGESGGVREEEVSAIGTGSPAESCSDTGAKTRWLIIIGVF
jgi:hypothetical protein